MTRPAVSKKPHILEVSPRGPDGPVYRYYRRDGRRLPLPGGDMDTIEFRQAYDACAAQFETKAPRGVESGTLDELVETYIDSPTFAALAPTTQKSRRAAVRRLGEAYGSMKLGSLGASHVQRYLSQKTASAQRGDVKALRNMFRLGRRYGLCDDITKDLEIERAKPTRGHATWVPEQIEAFTARWPVGTWPRLAFDLLRWTGASRVDLVNLGWQNVKGDLLVYTRSKTKRAAYVHIGPQLRAVLEQCRGRLLFLQTEAGAPFTSNGFGNKFNRIARETMGAGATCHGGRKAFTCWHLENAATPQQVAVMLGDNVTEVDRYGREMNRESIARAMGG